MNYLVCLVIPELLLPNLSKPRRVVVLGIVDQLTDHCSLLVYPHDMQQCLCAFSADSMASFLLRLQQTVLCFYKRMNTGNKLCSQIMD